MQVFNLDYSINSIDCILELIKDKMLLSKKVFMLIFSVFLSGFILAQDDTTVYTYVDQMPEFPGGDTALYTYLAKNIEYPSKALDNDIQGRVIIEFIIRNDGSVSDVTVSKGIGYGCDEEAVRVVKSMPRWKPGSQNGKSVNVTYRIPVKYTIHNHRDKKKKSARSK
jgi:TonB family protein